jgi:hypothetical protein
MQAAFREGKGGVEEKKGRNGQQDRQDGRQEKTPARAGPVDS